MRGIAPDANRHVVFCANVSGRDEMVTDPRTLLRRITDHDQLAFETVYRQYEKHVLLMAQRLLRSQCDAEEVLQDVFMALWHRPPSLAHGLPSLVAWLTSTTRNQCWQRVRRSGTKSTTRPGFRDPEYFDPVVEKILEAELRAIVEKEFLRTPQKQRAVLTLTYFGDLGATAVANELKIPVITVRKRLELAVKRLHRRLRPELVPPKDLTPCLEHQDPDSPRK